MKEILFVPERSTLFPRRSSGKIILKVACLILLPWSLLQAEVQFDKHGGISIVYRHAEFGIRNRSQSESLRRSRLLEETGIVEATLREALSQRDLLAFLPSLEFRLARRGVVADEILLRGPKDNRRDRRICLRSLEEQQRLRPLLVVDDEVHVPVILILPDENAVAVLVALERVR